MILVSDGTDDNHPIEGIADDTLNDRSRPVALGGKVKIQLLGWAVNGVAPEVVVEVPKEKTLTIHAVVMNDSPLLANGQAAAIQSVKDDIRRINERYAQIGLRVQLDNQGAPEFKAPPAAGSAVDPPLPDPNNPAQSIIPATTIAVGLAARPAAQPPVAEPEITLIYCKSISPFMTPLGEVAVEGFAPLPSLSPTHPEVWNLVFIAPEHRHFLVAHELGHSLSKRGHWPEDYEDLWTPPLTLSWPSIHIQIDLMRLGGELNDVTNAAPQADMPAKRLNFTEQGEIRKHPKIQ